MRAAWTWLRRLLHSLRGRGRDAELDEELRFHLDMQAAAEIRHGRPPSDAARAARLRLGGAEAIKEAYRDQKGIPVADALLQDVRYAARGLRRDAGFALIAVATLTLGIGATTTIFSLVRGVLLDPMPYPEAGRLIRVYESNPQFPAFPVGPYGLLAYRHENHTLAGFAGYVREDLQLAIDSRPERLRGLQVSSNYFQVLGVLPAIGRPFTWADVCSRSLASCPQGSSTPAARTAVPGRAKRWMCGGRCRSRRRASERGGTTSTRSRA